MWSPAYWPHERFVRVSWPALPWPPRSILPVGQSRDCRDKPATLTMSLSGPDLPGSARTGSPSPDLLCRPSRADTSRCSGGSRDHAANKCGRTTAVRIPRYGSLPRSGAACRSVRNRDYGSRCRTSREVQRMLGCSDRRCRPRQPSQAHRQIYVACGSPVIAPAPPGESTYRPAVPTGCRGIHSCRRWSADCRPHRQCDLRQ